MNQITKDLTLLPQFSAYHYMDVTSLLSAKAEEYSGHNGPPLGLWTWWTVFNALPEAAGKFGDSRSVCPETVEFDDNCFVWSDSALTVWKGCEDCGCPDYASHAAATGARSKEWMCLMYRSCSYSRTSLCSRANAARPALRRLSADGSSKASSTMYCAT